MLKNVELNITGTLHNLLSEAVKQKKNLTHKKQFITIYLDKTVCKHFNLFRIKPIPT